jgi:hypothetical protein
MKKQGNLRSLIGNGNKEQKKNISLIVGVGQPNETTETVVINANLPPYRPPLEI